MAASELEAQRDRFVADSLIIAEQEVEIARLKSELAKYKGGP